MKRILIQMHPEMITRLQSLAAQHGVSVACIIRSIVEKYFSTIDSKPST